VVGRGRLRVSSDGPAGSHGGQDARQHSGGRPSGGYAVWCGPVPHSPPTGPRLNLQRKNRSTPCALTHTCRSVSHRFLRPRQLSSIRVVCFLLLSAASTVHTHEMVVGHAQLPRCNQGAGNLSTTPGNLSADTNAFVSACPFIVA
jgi:hypothetical protein